MNLYPHTDLNELISCYYINLDSATERRAHMEERISRLSLQFTRISATSGTNLDPELLSGFDRESRIREFSYDLVPNEHACIQSHLRTMQEFLRTDKPYGLICEDDGTFEPHFEQSLSYILHKTSGWEVLRLYTEYGKRYPILGPRAGAPVELVFPRKVIYVSAGILYTREGAKQALEFFKHYSASFDYHLVRSCLDKGVPICGVYPNIMGITNSSSGQSTIDTSEVPRVRFSEDGRESLTQLLRRRLATWHYSIGKLRMRRLLRKVIRIGE